MVLKKYERLRNVSLSLFLGAFTFFGVIWAISAIHEIEIETTENNYISGNDVIKRVTITEELTTPEEYAEFFTNNSSNNIFMKQACNDSSAKDMLELTYDSELVTEICESTN